MNRPAAARKTSGRICLFAARLLPRLPQDDPNIMNVSRHERRVLNVLALGGRIIVIRDDEGRPIDSECYSREGWLMSDCNFDMFKRLRAKKVIASIGSGPYRITKQGLQMLRG